MENAHDEILERIKNLEVLVQELFQTTQRGVLDVDEAAEYIGISRMSLYRLMDADTSFPDFRPAGLTRRIIPRAALDSWLEKQVRKQAASSS